VAELGVTTIVGAGSGEARQSSDRPVAGVFVSADNQGAIQVAEAAPPSTPVRPGWAQPLRVHLSVVIVTLLISISAPLMWLTYNQGRREALAAAEQQMTLLGRHTIDRYRTLFGDGYSVVTMASAVKSLTTEPPIDIDAKSDFMLKVLEGSPSIDGLYVGYPSGAFVQALNVAANAKWRDAISAPAETTSAIRMITRDAAGEAKTLWRFLDRERKTIGQRETADVTFDPRRRPWYRATAHGTGVVSVGPYISASTGSLTLTLAAPSTKDDDIVVGADVLLETVSRLLANEPVSENSRGYLFDHEKRLIAHSEPAVMDIVLDSLATTPKVSGVSADTLDPLLGPVRTLLDENGDMQDRTVRFEVGTQPYLAEISSVGFGETLESNTIVVAAPLEDFLGPSILLLRKTLAIAGAFVVAGIVAALLIARGISRSLKALAADARQIGNLEFEDRAPTHSWIAEINTLAGALVSARDTIKTFALYVPRELVRRIVASGRTVVGSAVRQEVTVLFSDIRDFTTISERHSPEEVVSLLSGYFEVMNEIVERQNGVIIQYLGDSIYAMWNAPTSNANHVNDACDCALALKAGVDEYNRRCRERGSPELITRYGLHTGVAVIGSVGASSRRQYTAMGDTINVASRLEGLNKEFGTTILVSRAVCDRADLSFVFRPLGFAQAKGRAERIEVFELTARLETPS
jgi:adenylate cyclase